MKVQKLTSPAYAELYRPQYHYSAYDSWLNDPNGLVFFKGQYHMYYQSNPHSNVNGHMSWGHCVSSDLIHWEEREFVLHPDKLGDIWSGSAYADETNKSGLFKTNEGGIIAAYSTETQHIGLAYSEDGNVFTKFSDCTPVIENPNVKDFRDPCIFYSEQIGKWIMVIAGGLVRIYSSNDLRNWDCESVFDFNTECPSLFTMKCEGKEKWVLFRAGRGFIVGNFDGKTFTQETSQTFINEGPDAYAGIPFANTKDRRIIVNWFSSWKGLEPVGNWNGCMTLPFEIELVKINGKYRLRQTPVKEYECLKGDVIYSKNNIMLKDIDLKDIESNCFELFFEVDKNNLRDFQIEFFIGENHKTVLKYNSKKYTFTLDRSNGPYENEYLSSFSVFEFQIDEHSFENNKLNIKILADVCNAEIFINNGLYNGSYRINPFSTQQGINICGSNFLVDKLSIREMNSIHFENNNYPDFIHIPNSLQTEFECGKEYDFPIYYTKGKDIKVLGDVSLNIVLRKNHISFCAKKPGNFAIYFECGDYKDQINIVIK